MNELVEYETPQGKVELSAKLIREYLVNGQGNVTNSEIAMFLQICKYQKLNPWLREAYLIKYSDKHPASIVVAKQAFLNRAARYPKYKGHKAGVEIGEKGGIIKGWAEVYVKGYQVPIYVEVDFKEYYQPNKSWEEKPKTMIRKVALVQALREAFPEEFSGMYSIEEMPTGDVEVSDKPIKLVKETPKDEEDSGQPVKPKKPKPTVQGKKAKEIPKEDEDTRDKGDKELLKKAGELEKEASREEPAKEETEEEPTGQTEEEKKRFDAEVARLDRECFGDQDEQKKPAKETRGRNQLNVVWHKVKKQLINAGMWDDKKYRKWLGDTFTVQDEKGGLRKCKSSKELTKEQMEHGIELMSSIWNEKTGSEEE